MPSRSYKRKLAAILSADVKEYSRLMSEDEAHTIGTLTEYREIMYSFIQKKHGRVVDSPGDNLLAEFASVINAVQCAIEIQADLEAKNADLPENRRMEFRIGVNLGDVVGERSVKNIAEPINIYRVLMEPDAAGKVIGEKKAGLKGGQLAVVAAGALILVAAAMAIKVEKAERERAMRKDTDSLAAYDYLLRGLEYYDQRTRSANVKAKEMFNQAIELDSAYANAYVALAKSYVNDMAFGWTEFPAKARQKALNLVNKAITLDESNTAAHALIGATYVYQGEYDLALSELQQAIALNPNDASSYHILGWVALFASRTDEAIDALETVLRFDPNTSPTTLYMLGPGYYLKGQYNSAIKILKKGVARKSDFVDLHVMLAAAYAQAGRQKDAIRETQEILKLRPFFEVNSYGNAYRNPADREKILEGF